MLCVCSLDVLVLYVYVLSVACMFTRCVDMCYVCVYVCYIVYNVCMRVLCDLVNG